jgi:aryl-alcohol dehydrogenase-like predicted oxidoreductase
MKYRKLGSSDIDVSLFCLGTMTWGNQNSEDEAHAQLDYALTQGINFIDTAEMYPTPPSAETHGRTEEILGSWLKKRKDRDKLVIASKVAAKSERMAHVRDGNIRLDRKNIETAIDDSLRRLQTDYIDLYQTHWPDRDTNSSGQLNYFHAPAKDSTPIEETLDAMDGLIRAGKVRCIGVSNETAWGLGEHQRIIKDKGLNHIVSIQNPYNLLNRSFEIGLAEFAHREQISLLAYSPTAMGTLSGKYLDNKQPKDARLTMMPEFPRYKTRQGKLAIAQYVKLANEYGLDPLHMALAYVNTRPFITSSIIGASKLNQLESNIASIDLVLPKEVIKGIEKIHTLHPNPCP